MATHRRKVLVAFTLWIGIGASASADQIYVASAICRNNLDNVRCLDLSDGQQIWWRVVNFTQGVDTPFPGANDLRDVTLEFTYAGGSITSHWDSIAHATGPGIYGETEPFDVALAKQLVSLRLTATLTRTEFGILGEPYLTFVADSPLVTGTSKFPGVDVFAQGQYVMSPTPEPATLTAVGLGLGSLLAAFRAHRKRSP